MRIVLFALILALIASPSFGQKKKKKKGKKEEIPTWFYLQAEGGYGNSMFLNGNASIDPDIKMSFVNPSYSIGGKIGMVFPFGAGLAFELSSSGHNQKYEIISNVDGSTYEKNVSLKTFDKAILIRGVSTTGTYIEVGPQFSTIKTSALSSAAEFRHGMTSMVFGFGGAFYFHPSFDLNMGVRIGYSMGNIMVSGDCPYADTDYSIAHYATVEKTTPFVAQLKLGVNWHIGYFQKAKCDGHVEFLMF